MSLRPVDRYAITIHADESCLNNQAIGTQRKGACAGIVEIEGQRFTYAHASADTTNNRMAILSAILPLRTIPKHVPVVFVSDSRYLVDSCNSWIWNWAKNGWRSSKGTVENRDLWEEFLLLLQDRAIRFEWVKGHAGHPMNEWANTAAVAAAASQTSYNELEQPSALSVIARLTDAYTDLFEGASRAELAPLPEGVTIRSFPQPVTTHGLEPGVQTRGNGLAPLALVEAIKEIYDLCAPHLPEDLRARVSTLCERGLLGDARSL